jgi:hypothetical protein
LIADCQSPISDDVSPKANLQSAIANCQLRDRQPSLLQTYQKLTITGSDIILTVRSTRWFFESRSGERAPDVTGRRLPGWFAGLNIVLEMKNK